MASKLSDLSDLVVPMPVKHKLLERDIQKQCVEWIRARGYWARKFSSISQRSVPDYLFAHRRGKIKFAVEFKAPGKVSTAQQVDEQNMMILSGWYVFECADFEAFKRLVVKYEDACERRTP